MERQNAPLLIHLTTRAGELKLQYLTCYIQISARTEVLGLVFFMLILGKNKSHQTAYLPFDRPLYFDGSLFFQRKESISDGKEKETLKAVSKEIKIWAAAN